MSGIVALLELLAFTVLILKAMVATNSQLANYIGNEIPNINVGILWMLLYKK
ncbi:hypothetical protein KPL35_01345 [Clostridium sp. CF011]|uniref:hypothetical protein n=1 Tax=unclassified Clostridium TaxID=2614128 RepID=UPI001C0D6902|nr:MULTISPECIES: hypothetical protein [unclassified Clostridium]MBU3090738.1 hypothetical protein [Clostridium sp. CF011]MBW9144697.1 hypothetical protein [Clostridium sp. CM027]UVE40553.1 hypothetical protein KTC92_15735 [Clostridium sp. CM027]WAG69514.1 hypothetical protein LL036_16200 [Clostridium sp. CF011]